MLIVVHAGEPGAVLRKLEPLGLGATISRTEAAGPEDVVRSADVNADWSTTGSLIA